MIQQPAISVVMPIYNGESYLVDSIASIMTQSFANWELLCINDGSQDGTPELLDWFATQDCRIRVVHQRNAGLVTALNRGFAESRAPLIMRMDHDDLSLPTRMARQLAFLQDNPQCVVCGGAVMEMDACGDPLGVARLPTDHEAIVNNLMTRQTGHFHPTTMIRKDAFLQTCGYRSEYDWIEDHDLWLRLSEYGRLTNIPDVLLCYRLHASSICWQKSDDRRVRMNHLMQEAYQSRGRDVPNSVLADETIRRTAAGPGKWARAAAKRGYAASSWKHLRQLWKRKESLLYKVRMTAETMLRLGPGYLQRRSRENEDVRIPSFPRWQREWDSVEAKIRRAA